MRSFRAFAVVALVAGLGVPASLGSAFAESARSTTPGPVTRLAASGVTGSTVTLSWKNPAGQAFTGTMIRSAKGRTAPASVSSGALVKKLGRTAHSFTVTGLARSTTYSFSVFALGKNGRHSAPQKVTVKTTNRILNGVKTVVTNSNEACALFTSGRVDCWGYNVSDNLGSGSTTEYVTTPVHVKGVKGSGLLGGVRSLATDGAGFCGLQSNATLTCWGDNGVGDLGQGNTNPATYPVVVKGTGGKGTLTGVKQVVGGGFGYCVVRTSHAVDCWGSNTNGAVGSASTAPVIDTVTPVVGTDGMGALGGVASLTRVFNSTCAITTSNGVECWGQADPLAFGAPEGQLSSVPYHVPGVGHVGSLSGVSSLSIQSDTICAVLSSTAVDCWGGGPLGAGDSVPSSQTPVQVLGVGGTGTLTGVAEVIGDGTFVCARLSAGGMDCWGNDNNGQLSATVSAGDDSTVPVTVIGVGGTGTLGKVAAAAVNGSGVCAVTTTGGVVCWGGNQQGQLGNGNNIGPNSCGACNPTPAAPLGVGGKGSLGGIAHIVSDMVDSVGGFGYYTVTAQGGVDFWGGGTDAEGLFGTYPFQDVAKYATPAAE
jgi:alpha-tubulin suppressor-like RCC1 family protein